MNCSFKPRSEKLKILNKMLTAITIQKNKKNIERTLKVRNVLYYDPSITNTTGVFCRKITSTILYWT